MANDFVFRKKLNEIVGSKIEPFIEKIFAQCNFESVQTSLLIEELVDAFSDEENYSTFRNLLSSLFDPHIALTFDQFKEEQFFKKLVNKLHTNKFTPIYNKKYEEAVDASFIKDEIVEEICCVNKISPIGCAMEGVDDISVEVKHRLTYKNELANVIEELKCENEFLKSQNEILVTGNPHEHCEIINQHLLDELKQKEMKLHFKKREEEKSQNEEFLPYTVEMTQQTQTDEFFPQLQSSCKKMIVNGFGIVKKSKSFHGTHGEIDHERTSVDVSEIGGEDNGSLEWKIQQLVEEKTKVLVENKRLKKEIETRQKLQDGDSSGKCEHIDHNNTGTFEDLEELMSSIQNLEEENQAKDSLIEEYKSRVYELQCYLKLTRRTSPITLNSELLPAMRSRGSKSFQEELIDLELNKLKAEDINKTDPELLKIFSSPSLLSSELLNTGLQNTDDFKQKYQTHSNSGISSQTVKGGPRLNVFDYEHSTTSEEDCDVSRIIHWDCGPLVRNSQVGTSANRTGSLVFQTPCCGGSLNETHEDFHSCVLLDITDPNINYLPSPIMPNSSEGEEEELLGFNPFRKRDLIPRELICNVLSNSIPEESSQERLSGESESEDESCARTANLTESEESQEIVFGTTDEISQSESSELSNSKEAITKNNLISHENGLELSAVTNTKDVMEYDCKHFLDISDARNNKVTRTADLAENEELQVELGTSDEMSEEMDLSGPLEETKETYTKEIPIINMLQNEHNILVSLADPNNEATKGSALETENILDLSDMPARNKVMPTDKETKDTILNEDGQNLSKVLNGETTKNGLKLENGDNSLNLLKNQKVMPGKNDISEETSLNKNNLLGSTKVAINKEKLNELELLNCNNLGKLEQMASGDFNECREILKRHEEFTLLSGGIENGAKIISAVIPETRDVISKDKAEHVLDKEELIAENAQNSFSEHELDVSDHVEVVRLESLDNELTAVSEKECKAILSNERNGCTEELAYNVSKKESEKMTRNSNINEVTPRNLLTLNDMSKCQVLLKEHEKISDALKLESDKKQTFGVETRDKLMSDVEQLNLTELNDENDLLPNSAQRTMDELNSKNKLLNCHHNEPDEKLNLNGHHTESEDEAQSGSSDSSMDHYVFNVNCFIESESDVSHYKKYQENENCSSLSFKKSCEIEELHRKREVSRNKTFEIHDNDDFGSADSKFETDNSDDDSDDYHDDDNIKLVSFTRAVEPDVILKPLPQFSQALIFSKPNESDGKNDLLKDVGNIIYQNISDKQKEQMNETEGQKNRGNENKDEIDRIINKKVETNQMVDNKEEKKQVVKNKEEKEQVGNIKEQNGQIVNDKNQKDQLLNHKEQKDLVVSKTEKKDQVINNKEQKDLVVNNKEQKDLVVNNKEQKGQMVNDKDQKDLMVSKTEEKDQVINNKEQKDLVVENEEQKDLVVNNKEQKGQMVNEKEQKDQVINNKEEKDEVIDNKKGEDQVINNKEEKDQVINDKEQKDQIIHKGQGDNQREKTEKGAQDSEGQRYQKVKQTMAPSFQLVSACDSPITCNDSCNVKEIIDLFENWYCQNMNSDECAGQTKCNRKNRECRDHKYSNIFNRINDKLKEMENKEDDSFSRYRDPNESRHVLTETLHQCLTEMNESICLETEEKGDGGDSSGDVNDLIGCFRSLHLHEEQSELVACEAQASRAGGDMSPTTETNHDNNSTHSDNDSSVYMLTPEGRSSHNEGNKVPSFVQVRTETTMKCAKNKIKRLPRSKVHTINSLETTLKKSVTFNGHVAVENNNIAKTSRNKSLAIMKSDDIDSSFSQKSSNSDLNVKATDVKVFQRQNETLSLTPRREPQGKIIDTRNNGQGIFVTVGSAVCRYSLHLFHLIISLLILFFILILALVFYQEVGRRQCPICSRLLNYLGELLPTEFAHLDGPPPI